MWTFFLILAIIGILFLMVYLLLELNELEKKITETVQEIKKHFRS